MNQPPTKKSIATVRARVASPCVSLCSLDIRDICVGCYRSANEICDWMVLNDDERRAVLVKAAERNRKNNPFA
ncbi:MAG: DUF1289 domain-containing protein [Porticoccaceae bacterium]|nr:DUF1289 domain-containing protein [Porticoccaceae bacterium]